MNMRRLFVFFLLLLLISLLSCESKITGENKSKNPVEKYGDDVTKAYKGTQQFGKQMDVKNLQDAIRSFQVMNSRYPRDLAEVEHFTGTSLDSSKYDYDPSAGTIKEKE
jgi:outer membrane protein assembly factor BamD (BamD/ComL family)